MTDSRSLLPVATWRQIRESLTRDVGFQRRQAILAVVFIGIASGADLIAPWIVGRLVDGINVMSANQIGWMVLVMLGAAVFAGICTSIGLKVFNRVGLEMLAGLRERVLRRTLRLSPKVLEEAGIGDVLSRTGKDILLLSDTFASRGPEIIRIPLLMVSTSVGFFLLNWLLAIPALLVLIAVYVWAARKYVAPASDLYQREGAASGEFIQILIGSLRGRATLRAYRLEVKHRDRISERAKEVRDANIAIRKKFSQYLFRTIIAEIASLSVLLIIGFWGVKSGFASVGEVTTAVLFCFQAFEPLSTLLRNFDALPSAGASLTRLVGITEIPQPAQPTILCEPQGQSLVFDGVYFRYEDGPPVLSNVTLRIEQGERVALVGASGAGKTTLVNIATGLLTPYDGQVFLGGIPLTDLAEEQLQQRISLISQDVHVFSGPLVEDIRLANPEADDAQILNALRVVGADEWVRNLPEGLHTEVGELGHHLTASQAQQLALTRLFLRNPDIAILDEATAEAGSAGARELERAASAVIAGRTALIVAHRLTQAVLADRVVVMDRGRIVETGPHDDLVAAGGRYSELWRSWSGVSTRKS